MDWVGWTGLDGLDGLDWFGVNTVLLKTRICQALACFKTFNAPMSSLSHCHELGLSVDDWIGSVGSNVGSYH